MDIILVLLFYVVFFWGGGLLFFFIIVTGLNVSEFNRMYEILGSGIWDDLSVTQMLVRCMGHLEKDRLAE